MERKAIIRILIVAAVILFSTTSAQSELNAQRDFIYVVSIQSTINHEHICNGVILYDQWILTSAKCVQNYRAADLNIFYGSDDLKEGGKRVGIKTIVIPTHFDENRFKDDAALLRTATKIDFIANVSGPATLPAKDVPIDATVTVIGWKLMMNVNDTDTLQYQTTTTISGHQCRQLNPSLDHIIRSWLICTTDTMHDDEHHEQHTACSNGFGFGSPLVSNDNNILYGIMSMPRSTCGATVINDIYTNVYAQINWIWFVIEGM